ncbi:MAG: quercetin 2,3-dioxygenase [Solirubrobacterales bacterium]
MDSTNTVAPEGYREIAASESTGPAEGLPGKREGFFLDKGHGKKHTLLSQLLTTMISGRETDGKFSVIVLQGPASKDPVPAHYHTKEDEWTFILEGKVRWWVGNEHRLMYPGDSLYQPAMVPHAFKFEGGYNKMLAINVEAGFEDFFDIIASPSDLFSAPTEYEIPNQEQWREAAEKFGWHPVPDYDYGI